MQIRLLALLVILAGVAGLIISLLPAWNAESTKPVELEEGIGVALAPSPSLSTQSPDTSRSALPTQAEPSLPPRATAPFEPASEQLVFQRMAARGRHLDGSEYRSIVDYMKALTPEKASSNLTYNPRRRVLSEEEKTRVAGIIAKAKTYIGNQETARASLEHSLMIEAFDLGNYVAVPLGTGPNALPGTSGADETRIWIARNGQEGFVTVRPGLWPDRDAIMNEVCVAIGGAEERLAACFAGE